MTKTHQFTLILVLMYLLCGHVDCISSIGSRFSINNPKPQPEPLTSNMNDIIKLENLARNENLFNNQHLVSLSRLLIDVIRQKNQIKLEKTPTVYWYSRMGR